MNITEFVSKWGQSTLTERSASQQHFLDLCDLIGHPKPAALDPTGESFTFEKGVAKSGGGQGWADVWKRDTFAFEYKGKHKDLDAAHRQLLQYDHDLGHPPLLVTCDMTRIVIHTNFRGLPRQQHVIQLNESALGGVQERVVLDQLRDLFWHPERFKPGETIQQITERAASKLGAIARSMGERYEPTAVARFLDRIVFCLFAEDIDLLPHNLFSNLLQANRFNPTRFSKLIGDLFMKMAVGDDFGEHYIRKFNGNLFNEELRFDLTQTELDAVREAALMDWKNVDPSIFGTLFERGLDPEKRSQLGAHYTSRDDIETLIEPVIMQPLRREWDAVRAEMEAIPNRERKRPALDEATELIRNFLKRLSEVKVLDPACGSGNFLYVALQKLKDLEKSVLNYALDNKLGEYAPTVSPEQLYGIELNPYAYDLAQTTVWIGYLQWLRDNGFLFTEEPVLRKTNNIRNMDAVLDLSDPSTPKEPQWPAVDFIVGNPPFLGDKLMRTELGDKYVVKLRKLYADRIPGQSDFCCYWFEKSRQQIADSKCKRAGLIATQGIRGGANREVLKRIKESGNVYFAESDRNWILNGANVHISMVGFDNGSEHEHKLDGAVVNTINSDLRPGVDVTQARPLTVNQGICYLGVMKAGAFNIPEREAIVMLSQPNVHGRPNSDVLRPRLTAEALLQRTGGDWIIDFGVDSPEDSAAHFEVPFHHVEQFVKPARLQNRRARLAVKWWLHGEGRPGLRSSLKGLHRFIITPEVSKHRIFAWLDASYIPDHQTRAFARDDDYFFGVLHSRLHEVWARAQGTQLRERESGFRYTPTSCFETFPFPDPTPEQWAAIGEAAGVLHTLRSNWLNPPEWTREEILEFPGSTNGPWARYVHDADSRGIGVVRYPRIVPKDAILAKNLVKRTLTNLYNERPAWLDNAHRKLDAAVFAAYGWEPEMSDEQILEKLLALNLAI